MQTLPVIHITADNHYDVGRSIGTTFKGFIGDYIRTSKDVELFRQFYDSKEGRPVFDEYVKTSETYFPEIVDEIRGIADGAGQEFVDIFLIQLASEIRMSHQFEMAELTVKPPEEEKGCTDILCNSKTFRVMAHNDDWSDEVAERVYFGHVTITSGGEKDLKVKEHFMAYMYPGNLAGFCFGMNEDLVFTLDTVRPVTANRKGVPLAIVMRKLLACYSIEECSAMMENKPVGSAFGMNINIAEVHGDGMWSLEVYPEKLSTRVSLRRVETNSQYCHTNYYKHTKNVVVKPREGTFLREKRAQEMMSHPLTCIDDVLRLLGDTSDELEPIYRLPSAKHIIKSAKTSATAVFDFNKRRLDIYRMNPKLAKSPCYSTAFL